MEHKIGRPKGRRTGYHGLRVKLKRTKGNHMFRIRITDDKKSSSNGGKNITEKSVIIHEERS